jgi:endogenous inhibitor of DNA gyrase (YacG/DUF329 family)
MNCCLNCKSSVGHHRVKTGLCRTCWSSKVKLLPINCASCGKRFEPQGSSIKFCSKSCFGRSERGEKNHKWKGGKATTSQGYILLYSPEHPMANANGYVMEHRLVMETHIGRLLSKQEVVHHRDENKSNNRLENLEIMTRGAHSVYHNGRPDLVPEIPCRKCGKNFKGRRYIADATMQAFCSRKCYVMARTGIKQKDLAIATARRQV